MSKEAPTPDAKPSSYYAALGVFCLASVMLAAPWILFHPRHVKRALGAIQRVAAITAKGLENWPRYNHSEIVPPSRLGEPPGEFEAQLYAAVLVVWLTSGLALARLQVADWRRRLVLETLLFTWAAFGAWHHCTNWQHDGSDTMLTKLIHMSVVVVAPPFCIWLLIIRRGLTPSTQAGMMGMLAGVLLLALIGSCLWPFVLLGLGFYWI